MNILNISFAIFCGLAALSSIFTGILVFLKRQDSLGKSWFFLSLSVFLWSLGLGLMVIANNKQNALMWCYIHYLGCLFIPANYSYFIFSFFNIQEKKKNYLLILYILSFVLVIFNSLGLIVKDVTKKIVFNYYTTPSTLYFLFPIIFFVSISYALILTIKFYKNIKGTKREQIKYIILASFIGFIGGSTTFLPVFDILVYPWGMYIVFIYPILIAYAIVKYHLMDIRIVITRGVIFLFVYFFVLGIPFWIGYLTKSWILTGILMFILSTAGIFIYNHLRKQLEAILRAEQLRTHRMLTEAAKGMLRIWDLNRLLKLIVYTVSSALRLKNAGIYLFDEKAGDFRLKAIRIKNTPYPELFKPNEPLIKEIFSLKDVIIYEEANSTIKPLLEKYSWSVIIPAFSKEKILGFMFLERKRTFQSFNPEDILLFRRLSFEASLAIDNSLLYEREKNYLVEESRKKALADMAPGASHQFNNRLATISSTADNLLDLLQDISSQEFLNQRDFILSSLRIIADECFKGRQITEAILYKAKAKLEFTKTDITRLIQNAITLTKIRRSKQSLLGLPEPEFSLNSPENLPLLWLSEATIEESFECIFNNSIDAGIKKYTLIQKGELNSEQPYRLVIEITLKLQENFLFIEILDNGLGIKPQDLPKVFTPYFTTKSTSEKGICGGVGLGLWVIRDYIEKHRGTINIESEYSQWTKVTIKLPLDFVPGK